MTTSENDRVRGDRKRIEELLRAYGRNPLRWPHEDQVRFAQLLRDPSGLPSLLAEEEAGLDRLLDLAGPSAVDELPGARQRLLGRMAQEVRQLPSGPEAVLQIERLSGWQQGVAVLTLAVAIFAGVTAGQSSETVAQLAGFLGFPVDGAFALDTVWLFDPSGDEGVL